MSESANDIFYTVFSGLLLLLLCIMGIIILILVTKDIIYNIYFKCLRSIKIHKCLRVSKSYNLNDSCIICYDNYDQSSKVSKFKKCQHHYHSHCIKKWLYQDNRCPLCMDSIV